MHLQPGTPAFEQFIADNLGEGFEAWERDVLLLDQPACLTCGATFTCEADFDEDELRNHGERICVECSIAENFDPIRRRWAA